MSRVPKVKPFAVCLKPRSFVYMCKLCDKMFENPTTFRLHRKAVHSDKEKIVDTVVCAECKKTFPTSKEAYVHMRIHKTKIRV